MILSPSRKKRVLLMLIVLIAGLAIYTASIVHFGYAQTPFVKNTLKQYEFSAIKPEMLPKGWLNDLLMIEDPQFYQHSGIDLTTDGAGLTTITQGLVKIYYFDSFKPGVAKYKQSILALILDSQVSKNDQLTLFLNTARLGHIEGESIRGFQRASRAYFNKNFIDLTHSEYLSGQVNLMWLSILKSMPAGSGGFNCYWIVPVRPKA